MTVRIETLDEGDASKHFDIYADDELVGSFHIVEHPTDSEVDIVGFKVKQEHKRKGYGREAVKQLELFYDDSPYELIVAANVTEEGKKFWPTLGYTSTESPYDLAKRINEGMK